MILLRRYPAADRCQGAKTDQSEAEKSDGDWPNHKCYSITKSGLAAVDQGLELHFNGLNS